MKSHLLILSFATILLALSAVASACGGGNDELKRGLESVAENDLAIMVLPQEAYGDVAEGLQVDADSGFDDSDDVADSTLDPEDTADDIEEAGFVTGYSLNFEDPAFSALEEGEGILSASSTVELFEDEQAASSHLDKLLEDNRRFEGEQYEPGATLEEVEEFVVEGIADDATGMILHASFGDTDFYATGVIFTVGRLRAGAGITTADDGDVTADAERIGRALAERIEGVLVGDIDGTPVPIPEEEEEEAEGRAPSEPPFPDDMVLSLEDLPEGASVEQEGYVEDPDMVSNYERDFDVSSVDIGSSRAVFLGSEIQLYADVREAAGVLQMRQAAFTGESGRDFFESMTSENQEMEITLIGYKTADVPGLGDGRVAIQYSYDSPFGEFDGVIINLRVGRAIAVLTVEGLAADIELADVVSLARAMAERMEATLEAAGEDTGEAALVPQEAVGVAEGFLEPFGLAGALQPVGGQADLPLTEGGPLEDMLLSSEDVPPGYQKLFAGSSSFEIEPSFGEPSPGEVTMAMSMFADEGEQHMIMSMVMQAEDEAVAQEGLAEISEVDLAEMEELFAAYELFGIQITNVRLVDASGLGDGGFGFGFTMDFSALIEELGEEPLGEEAMELSAMDMEMVMFLDGSLVAMVMTMGTDEAAPLSQPLAEIMAAKMTAAS
jgi:hypothetical protein